MLGYFDSECRLEIYKREPCYILFDEVLKILFKKYETNQGRNTLELLHVVNNVP